MKVHQTDLEKRKHFFWLGQKYEGENNISKAIQAYQEYSKHLAQQDKHIPHYWISILYEKIGQINNALTHLELFAKGCTSQKAAEVYKEIGEKYLKLNSIEKAKENFQQAVKNNPNIGVRKKLDDLKNR